MFRSKPDAPLFIDLFVVPAESLAARFSRALVEPDAGKQPPGGFNAHLGSALALVRDNLDLEARFPQRAFVGNVIDLLVVRPVMGKDAESLSVAIVPKP